MPSWLFFCQDARQGLWYLLCINILWNQMPWGIREDRWGVGSITNWKKSKLIETLPTDNYSGVNFRRGGAQAAHLSFWNVFSASNNLTVLLEYLFSHWKQDMVSKDCACLVSHQERTAFPCRGQPARGFPKQYVEQNSVCGHILVLFHHSK